MVNDTHTRRRSVLEVIFTQRHSNNTCLIIIIIIITIHAWCKKFARGHESVADDERPHCHIVLTTNAMLAALLSDWCLV